MVVVDHDTGRLVWAAESHDRKTLQQFFDLLGAERCAKIRLVTADAAEWIAACALDACERATLCLDPFHIVRWATNALDVVRRFVWNVLRRLGAAGQAAALKGCRYALWKKPEDLTDRQRTKLAWIARHNQSLYRAYLLKEQLRLVFHHLGEQAIALLDAWRGTELDECVGAHCVVLANGETHHTDRAEALDLDVVIRRRVIASAAYRAVQPPSIVSTWPVQ